MDAVGWLVLVLVVLIVAVGVFVVVRRRQRRGGVIATLGGRESRPGRKERGR